MLLVALAALLDRSVALDACAARPVAHPAFDASLLKPGVFTYEYRVRGKVAGRFVTTVRRLAADRWEFSGDGDGQHWESVATAALRPVSATLQFRRKDGPYRMELVYGRSSVRFVETLNGVAGPAKTVDVPAWIVDQRVDWAAVMSSRLRPGRSLTFAVFDPATGVSTVEASATRLTADAKLPARGRLTRLDYQVCKNGSVEKYSVFSTTRAPLILARENLRDDEVDTLVGISPIGRR